MDTRPPWPDGPPWMARYHRSGAARRGRTVFLALFVAAVQVTACVVAARSGRSGVPLDALAFALLIGGAVALVWRRSRPVATYAVAQVATVAYLVLDYPRGLFFLAALVALINAARRGGRAAISLITALGYGAYVLLTWDQLVIDGRALNHATLGEYVVVGAWTAVALAVAELVRARSAQFAEMARTREEQARTRQEQARRQASDERLRIAQELHDVLGHHLSLINVRAGVALHLLDSQPEQARDALSAIKLASAEALRETRAVLATLSPENAPPPRSPASGLADIDRLAQDARDAGLTVHIRQSGQPRPVPGEVDRAGYRIVREALTNVRRHAGPAADVEIVLHFAPAELRIEVTDTGTGFSTSDGSEVETGNGIPGMRERAVALGGTLIAENGPGGGFRVEARLPLPSTEEHE